MFPIVALDIETTGLRIDQDAIIEIGAVKHDGNQIIEEWQTLINPQRVIPNLVTQLTGITNEMVLDAPPVSAVIQGFADFVGDLPIIGHNISFDLGFLNRYLPFTNNPVNDTFEISAVLLPKAPRYSLAALVEILELKNQSPHRAKEDADATLGVFLKLAEKAKDLPVQINAEIVQASQQIDWQGKWFFTEILRHQSKKPVKAKEIHPKEMDLIFQSPETLLAQPLKPNEAIKPLDIEELTAILSPGGEFSTYLDQFEFRNEQLEMLQSVGQALSDSNHLMVEAGTGIGKSFAYLVPAAKWSTQNNLRVVISTNTLNLQDQLIQKDIPDLKEALGIDLNVTVLKGRANYLCPRRYQALRHRKPRDASELRLLGKILVWTEEGGSGIVNEINLTGPLEHDAWRRISAQDESCNAEVCINRMGGVCPYYRARVAAQSAHIIIVNHALLLSDVITNNRVLPDFNYLIIDEAHHLEDASTNALSYRVSRYEIERLFQEIGGMNDGILERIKEFFEPQLKPSEKASAMRVIERAADLAFRSESKIYAFLSQLEKFLEEVRDGRRIGEYGQKVRIVPAVHAAPIWSDVEIAWDATADPVDSLINTMETILKEMVDTIQSQDVDTEDLFGDLSSVIRRLKQIFEFVGAMVFDLDLKYIYWIEIDQTYRRLSLHFAPLHIGELMETYLWHTKESVIITSATLTANDQFDFIRNRLNADEADELVIGSPFDYENAAMLFLPTDMPEPNDYRNYQRFLERSIIRTAGVTGGRMLVLFTSYKQLKAVSSVIAPVLSKNDIQVYEQGEGASASSLLNSFKSTERAVLLGTRSFWEGVDIPGDDLSVLMITKLPFDVPSDPVIAARSETFENSFSEYMLPEAILRFRQGFGRLIRTQSDRGVVAVLDQRIRSKQYGKYFLHSLPDCHVVTASIEELPTYASQWLGM